MVTSDGNSVRLIKAHRKSRSGCGSCKLRKVKVRQDIGFPQNAAYLGHPIRRGMIRRHYSHTVCLPTSFFAFP